MFELNNRHHHPEATLPLFNPLPLPMQKPAGDASNPAAAAAPAQPQTLSYPSFTSAMSVDVGTLPASSHPLYLVMQGKRLSAD